MNHVFKNYILPVVSLMGGIIGVGFLSLPYIALKVGVVTMLVYFVILTVLVLFLHIIVGEISLKTPDFKRWPGFVEYYLGKGPKNFILISEAIGLMGVMLVYLLVGRHFLMEIFNSSTNQSLYTFIFFIPSAILVFIGVKFIARVDFLALVFLFLTLLILGIFSFRLDNLLVSNFHFGTTDFFLPYGAIVFSLWGAGFIPEMEEMVRGNKRVLKTLIATAIILVAAFYVVFMLVVLGISGKSTTDSALVGLKDFLHPSIYVLALSIGVTTTFLAFIATGLLLEKILMYDVGLKKQSAWLVACFLPLTFFLLGFNSFIGIISFIGGVLLGIDGILILLIYRKIGGKRTIAYPLVGVFILGIIYSLMYSFT